MSDTDPLDRLASVRDTPEEPDAEFSERLLESLLADLSAPPSRTTAAGSIIELQERSIDMETPNRKWLPGLLAAAAVTLLVVGAIIVAQRDGDDQDQTADQPVSTDSSPTTPANPTTGPSAVETVRSAIDAFNAADIEGLTAVMEFGDQTDVWTHEASMIADSQWTEVEQCREVERADLEVTEFVPWGPEHERFVHCVLAKTDDFFGPSGLDRDEVFECGVTAEDRMACVDRYLGPVPSLSDDALDAYLIAFWEWLRTARPDTYAEIESSDGEIPGSQGDPDQMTVALSVLDDFLTQSDRYPTVHATFTGDDCLYSGPTEFEVGDEFVMTASVVTEELTSVGFGVILVEDGTTVAEARDNLEEVVKQDAEDSARFLNAAIFPEGTTRVLPVTLDVAGTWLVNCFILDVQDFPATTFEVVEES